MAVKKEAVKVDEVRTFPKETLLKAKVFANRKDALAVVIKDDEVLSIAEAQSRLDDFLKGEVK